MKKLLAFAILFSITPKAFSQLKNLNVTFQQKEIGNFSLVPIDNQFTAKENEILDNWIKSKIKLYPIKLNYINLNFQSDLKTNVYNSMTGCLPLWINSLDSGLKLNLFSYFSNTSRRNLDDTQIKSYSDNFKDYVLNNFQVCQNTPPLADPLYISMGFNEYLSSKIQGIASDDRYIKIFDDAYTSLSKYLNQNASIIIKSWLDSIQQSFLVHDYNYINSITNDLTLLDGSNESDFFFKIISIMKKNDPNFNENLDNLIFMKSITKVSHFIYNQCSDFGLYSFKKCSSNPQNQFISINLKRGNDKFINDITFISK